MSTRSTRNVLFSIALLLAAAAVGWLWLFQGDADPSSKPSKLAAGDDEATRDTHARTQRPARPNAPVSSAARTPSATTPPTPAAGCTPEAGQQCYQGDVYWLDSCGARGAKAEECGARLCKLDACEPTDELACAGLPIEGECDGTVVRGCLGGVPFERDCARYGQQCVVEDEGAVCKAPSRDDCDRHGTLPRCEGQVLHACVDGKHSVRDCAAIDARCELTASTGRAACVVVHELERAPRDDEPCGPCGCPDGTPEYAGETCNGADDDGDAWVDEDAECEPLDVVAYLVTDGAGAGNHSREDVEQEIELLDALYTGSSADQRGLRMHFRLAAVHTLARAEYLSLDDEELDALVIELNQSRGGAGGPGLHVPIVFTDEIVHHSVPKPGLSTLPNGHCGGLRRTLSPQPLRGLVAVGKQRARTTVAHEVGHFLGLCHTHEAADETLVQVARYRTARGMTEQTCDASCALEGDGICDTPPDPGPELCDYDQECIAHCETPHAPSTRNLMSYYTSCRTELTPLQTVTLRRSRALLEGFYRCADPGSCPCEPDASGACPEQMSCRPSRGGGFQCSLDGAFVEGEPCRAHVECGSGLSCIEGRCAQWGGAY